MPARRFHGVLQTSYREQMRAQLGERFFAVFSERGFEEVTVAELAHTVGISRASFFRYFESKEEAVLCGCERLGEELAAGIAARPAREEPWAALRAASAEAVDRVFANREEGKVRVAMIVGCASLRQHYAGLQEGWRAELAAALGERIGAAERSVGVEALSATAMKLVGIALGRWCGETGPEAPGRSVELAFDSLVSGLGRDPQASAR
jgi:AcrR family transcriptional regulator